MSVETNKTIGKWNFAKLPPSEYDNVKNLISQGKGVELLSIHEKYNLSTELYCCGGDSVFVLMYFKKAEIEGFFNG